MAYDLAYVATFVSPDPQRLRVRVGVCGMWWWSVFPAAAAGWLSWVLLLAWGPGCVMRLTGLGDPVEGMGGNRLFLSACWWPPPLTLSSSSSSSTKASTNTKTSCSWIMMTTRNPHTLLCMVFQLPSINWLNSILFNSFPFEKSLIKMPFILNEIDKSSQTYLFVVCYWGCYRSVCM